MQKNITVMEKSRPLFHTSNHTFKKRRGRFLKLLREFFLVLFGFLALVHGGESGTFPVR